MTEVFGSASSKDDIMVQLSVPARFYPEVLQYLGELYRREVAGQGAPVSEPPSTESGEQPTSQEWTREDIQRLKALGINSTIVAVFDLAKERENRLLSIRELEQHTGRKYEQVRADFGGFTRKCRSRLNKEHWPFAAIWAADGKPQMSYQVPEDVLQWWHED